MKVLRTPDSCFENLPDYPFEPNYLFVNDTQGGELRLHYVDEGPASAAPVLLLHGEPSWSFLYRKMIPIIANAGFRTVAPDLIGFGRSDKPGSRDDYTYQHHVDWITEAIEKLDLRNITLVCQDWGGLIGLRILAEQSQRFARVVTANTFLPTGDQPASNVFLEWQRFSQDIPVFPVGKIIDKATTSELSPEVIAAYDAPFPDEEYKAGARQFPMLVPITPDNPATEKNRAAWEVLKSLQLPFLTAFSDQDPITAGADTFFQNLIPGAKNQPHTTIINGGHFLQEDQPEKLAQAVLSFVATP